MEVLISSLAHAFVLRFKTPVDRTMCATRFCLLIKISKNPDGRNGTGRDGQARFAHSNVKGASAIKHWHFIANNCPENSWATDVLNNRLRVPRGGVRQSVLAPPRPNDKDYLIKTATELYIRSVAASEILHEFGAKCDGHLSNSSAFLERWKDIESIRP